MEHQGQLPEMVMLEQRPLKQVCDHAIQAEKTACAKPLR